MTRRRHVRHREDRHVGQPPACPQPLSWIGPRRSKTMPSQSRPEDDALPLLLADRSAARCGSSRYSLAQHASSKAYRNPLLPKIPSHCGAGRRCRRKLCRPVDHLRRGLLVHLLHARPTQRRRRRRSGQLQLPQHPCGALGKPGGLGVSGAGAGRVPLVGRPKIPRCSRRISSTSTVKYYLYYTVTRNRGRNNGWSERNRRGYQRHAGGAVYAGQ